CFFLFMLPVPPQTCTLSLHDALPIWTRRPRAGGRRVRRRVPGGGGGRREVLGGRQELELRGALFPSHRPWRGRRGARGRGRFGRDRKSTRLNSSHVSISYAVFCLKKK